MHARACTRTHAHARTQTRARLSVSRPPLQARTKAKAKAAKLEMDADVHYQAHVKKCRKAGYEACARSAHRLPNRLRAFINTGTPAFTWSLLPSPTPLSPGLRGTVPS